MNSGIYRLTFATGDTYIGKSNDMERRYNEHCDKLKKGTAAGKMQSAFYVSQALPISEIMMYCHEDYLDYMEGYYIDLLRPTLNTSIPQVRDGVNILLDNEHFLEYSIAAVCQVLRNHDENAAVLQESFDNLTANYNSLAAVRDAEEQAEYAEAELMYGKDRNKSLVLSQAQTIEELKATIFKMNKRTLLQRIFNCE